jgi:hypothetical protein
MQKFFGDAVLLRRTDGPVAHVEPDALLRCIRFSPSFEPRPLTELSQRFSQCGQALRWMQPNPALQRTRLPFIVGGGFSHRVAGSLSLIR